MAPVLFLVWACEPLGPPHVKTEKVNTMPMRLGDIITYKNERHHRNAHLGGYTLPSNISCTGVRRAHTYLAGPPLVQLS